MAHGSPETSSSESSTSARSSVPAVWASREATIAPSMSTESCGGPGRSSRPVIAARPLR